MLHYIFQTILFQLFFLIVYDFLLKKETFFNWNRAYLLVTILLSVVLPFIKTGRFKNVMSQEHFNTKIGDKLNLTGMQRINVMFKINAQGNIDGVKARAKHPELEAEAIRVIKLLPQFKPGTQDGKAVNVPYSLPIVFQIEE